MINVKMSDLSAGGSAIRVMFEEGNRLAALYGRDKVFDFSIGNPNFPAPPEVNRAIRELVDTQDPVYLHGYMPNPGYPEVRQAVADWLNGKYGTHYGVGQIIMTCGAAGGLNLVLKTLLNEGEEVLTFAPYFFEYGRYVGNYGGVFRVVPADTETFQPNVEALGAMLTPKTKAIIVNSPNNPTGVIYSEEVIRRLAALLEEKQREFGTSIYLISDEPYRELAYDGAVVPWLPNYYRNTIVGYSWSKALSLPGERIGYLAVSPEADDSALICDAVVIANRICGFINAPSLMQLVVAKCLDARVDLSGYDENRRLLYQGLTDLGYECVFPQGAFYLWMKTPCPDTEFDKAAMKQNIMVVNGTAFGCPGYTRIAYCVNKSTIVNSMPGFAALAKQYGLTPRKAE